ncbi:MAG: adenosylmethionine--8-amino-7-oxononanoate transaminase [Desulfobacter sp.]
MTPNGLVITGTDTDIGKTVVTAALIRAFNTLEHPVHVLKPVQTGCSGGAAPDVEVYRTAGHSTLHEPIYCFDMPCSPHLAAEKQGQEISLDRLADRCRKVLDAAPFTLIEGAGGIFTPLNRTASFLDLVKQLGLRAVVVADNRLGMLNHTVLTMDALEMNGITVAALVINHCAPAGDKDQEIIQQDNPDYLRQKYPDIPVIEMPFHKGLAPDDPETWAGVEVPLTGFASALVRPENQQNQRADDVCAVDKKHIWHPYTSLIRPLSTYTVYSAEGHYIHTDQGPLLDGMSSWWCAVHGYNHPRLNRAAIAQINQMSHVMFGGLTHRPAVSLAKRLLRLMPQGLEHIFYADSGSVSVEVALKMALQYWQGRGKPEKKKILTVCGGYHGDTFGAMSVCDPVNGMHRLFTGFLPQQLFAGRPDTSFHAPYDPTAINSVHRLMAEHHHAIAAVIIEPVVQGAGSMWFYHPDYLDDLKRLCDQYGILLICDEIATGFGRTGRLFACDWAGIRPDILCMGKALTGGYMSFAAVAATAEVGRGVSNSGGVLMHGPTYMGNPLACAVACESLDLLLETPWKNRVKAIEAGLEKGLAPCRNLPGVADVRVLGAIGVVELNRPVDLERIQAFFVRRGVWIRPFGRIVYVMPPFSITGPELSRLTQAITAAVQGMPGNGLAL